MSISEEPEDVEPESTSKSKASATPRSKTPLPAGPSDMYIVVKGADTWKAFVSIFKSINMDSVTFEISSEGLKSKAQDPSHVNGVAFNWPSASFEKFQCEREVRVTLNVADLVKVMSRASKDDDLVFLAPIGIGSAPESLTVALVGAYPREFSLRWMESPPPSENRHIPLDPQVRAVISKARFGSIIADVGAVSDKFFIKSNADGMIFNPKGEGIAKAVIEQARSDPATTSIEIMGDEKEVDGLYNVVGLDLTMKHLGTIAETVMIEYATNRPMVVTTNLNSLGATLKFLTAPRIYEFKK